MSKSFKYVVATTYGSKNKTGMWACSPNLDTWDIRSACQEEFRRSRPGARRRKKKGWHGLSDGPENWPLRWVNGGPWEQLLWWNCREGAWFKWVQEWLREEMEATRTGNSFKEICYKGGEWKEAIAGMENGISKSRWTQTGWQLVGEGFWYCGSEKSL